MNPWIQFAIDTLQPVILALLSLLSAYAVAYIRRKATNEKVRAVGERAAGAVCDAVRAIEQTFVSKLREHGAISADNAQEAASLALDTAREFLGPKGVAELRAVLGSGDDAIDSYLLSLIEAKIAAVKAEK